MKLRKNNVDSALRGGCYFSDAGDLRVTYRIRLWPGIRGGYGGFRFVLRGKR